MKAGDVYGLPGSLLHLLAGEADSVLRHDALHGLPADIARNVFGLHHAILMNHERSIDHKSPVEGLE